MIDYKTLYKETQHLSVLWVEDFQALREEMQSLLEDLFAKVVCAEDGVEALSLYLEAQVQDETFDLVISDIQMPKMDGVELARQVRKQNEEQVIIILSAYTETKYLLKLINIGISKFLTKPIEHEELFEVLHRESRRINTQSTVLPQEQNILTLAEGYTWTHDTQVLKHEQETISLTRYELLLLEFFIRKQECVCTNTEIIDMYYNYTIEMNENNIRNLVFKLRKKIPEKCVQNIYGLGYKFTLQIEY